MHRRWLLCLAGAAGLAWGEPLPKDLTWQTNDDLPSIASPKAQKGGKFRVSMSTYPLTFRYVGPDSNTVLYTAILDNKLSLVGFHPNNRKPIPLLATHWAFADDKRTVYYKLNPKAKWSDGKPVTAEDFVFMLEFYRSKYINAPWYNTFYTQQIEAVKAYGKDVVSVTLPQPKPDLLHNTSLSPVPKHFYNGKLSKDFVMRYNWKVEPNTGPYIIDQKKVRKGKSVTWKRKKDWWAKDMPYFKNRFNVDKVEFRVVREQAVSWERFKGHKLDAFDLAEPVFWHERSKADIFKKGYAQRLWFYNDRPQPCFGLWLNTATPIFKDKKVREAVHYAVNFDKVIKLQLRGEQERMNSCTHGYGKYSKSGIKARPFDIKKATALLKEAGFTTRDKDGVLTNAKGQRVVFDLLYAYDGHKDKLVVLVEEMRKAGIQMNLDLKDWSAMVKQKNSNKHEAAYSGYGAREFGVPTFWGLFHQDNANKPNSNNTANLADPALSKAIDDYRKATDEPSRIKLAHDIQQRIHDAAVFVPAFIKPWGRYAYWRWWQLPDVPTTKISATPFTLFDPGRGGLFWFDKKLKEETLAAMKSSKSFAEVTRIDRTFQPTQKGQM